MSDCPVLAVVGGTGHLGGALARRWARGGYPVILGSRDARRAEEAAARLAPESAVRVRGFGNRDAAERGEIVIITVPWASHEGVLEEIRPAVAGKLVVDTTVPLVPPRVARVQLPPAGSAALIAKSLLGPEVRVVSAFQNVAAEFASDPACNPRSPAAAASATTRSRASF